MHAIIAMPATGRGIVRLECARTQEPGDEAARASMREVSITTRIKESAMNRPRSAVALLSMVIAAGAWAQTAAQPDANAHSDEIVKMRMQISAANQKYNKKVAAAKKVYDQKKAEAAKERDAAIEAARSGAGQ